jgi:hypothetical protein
LQDLFKGTNLSEFAMIYILDDRDDYNIGLTIALISVSKNVPVTVSLFNENIAPHLKAAHPNIHIMNPAQIAAPAFVRAINQPVERFLRYQPVHRTEQKDRSGSDSFVKILVSVFPDTNRRNCLLFSFR